MRPDNVIVLMRRQGAWWADYQGPHSVVLVEVFGTSMFPTAYASYAPGHKVRLGIQRLHPGVDVKLAMPK